MCAQACRLADRWGATICLDLCFTTLSKVKDEELCKELDGVLALLPDSISELPEYAAWVNRQARLKSAMGATAVPLDQFFDVHALITSTEALQLFHQLSFADMRSWVGSEQLVVDSEDSVAVAIGVWTQWRTCSNEELIQLCSLLRVRHLSTGALLLIAQPLPSMSHMYACLHAAHLFGTTEADSLTAKRWFRCSAAGRRWIDGGALPDAAAAAAGDLPPHWLAPARKQLDAAVLAQRMVYTWDIPFSDLLGALRRSHETFFASPPVYSKGTGTQIALRVSSKTNSVMGGRTVNLYMRPCSFMAVLPSSRQQSVKICHERAPLACSFTVRHTWATGSNLLLQKSRVVIETTEEYSTRTTDALTPISIMGLRESQQLVNGCMRLQATVTY
jgi:hypothetical protein